MTGPWRVQSLRLFAAVTLTSIWAASHWWEKGLAIAVDDAELVSNGCAYVQTFKPFWLLPNVFHPKNDPNHDIPARWFSGWGYPGFYRLFDSRDGTLLGETEIYDLEYASGHLWENSKGVYAGIIFIGPIPADCLLAH